MNFDTKTKTECKLITKTNEHCLANNNFFVSDSDDFDDDVFYKFIASMIPHGFAMAFLMTMMQAHLLNQFFVQKFNLNLPPLNST